MRAQVHEHVASGGGPPAGPATTASRPPAWRPRWLVPGLVVAVAVIVGALVVAGVVSASTVLYAGLVGGMMLIHLGGHGHGGHGGGGTGCGHTEHGDATDDAGDLSRDSADVQPSEPRSAAGLDERARNDSATRETDGHDQHRARGCH